MSAPPTGSGCTYDASGDLTADGTHTFQYDAEGRLVSVDNGSTASYVYNALGERVERDVSGSYTEYIFDKDGNPLGENNRTTWVDTWVDFDGQHIAHYENNETYFVHSNQVGTASMVTDYSGALVQDELHYPWGQAFTTIGTQTEERFASLHHRDTGTNLDPTHFRMYSSDQGRWLTPDPAQADIFHPQSMSRYAYAGGNPAAIIDPGGAVNLLGYDVFGGGGGYLAAMFQYNALASIGETLLNGLLSSGAGVVCPNDACTMAAPDPYTKQQTLLQFTATTEGSAYVSTSDWSQGLNWVNGILMTNAQYNAYIQVADAGDITMQRQALAAAIAANSNGAISYQEAYDSLKVVGGHPQGGNYNFVETAYGPANLDCGGNPRCNGVHFPEPGFVHLDTANPWASPLGFAEHGFVDVFLGNTLFSGGFIPRPFP